MVDGMFLPLRRILFAPARLLKKLLAIVFLGALLSLWSCTVAEQQVGRHDLMPGDVIPPFSVETLDGHFVSDQVLLNTPAVIVFGTPDCDQCKKAYMALDDIRKKDLYIRDRLSFLIVCSGDGSRTREWFSSRGITIPCSPQEDDTFMRLFLTRTALPVVFLVNEDGTIERREHNDNYTAGNMRPLLYEFASSVKHN